MLYTIIPTDLWFLIALYTQQYSTYQEIANVIPQLHNKYLSKYARLYFTEYTKSQFYEEWTLDGKFHREETDEKDNALPAVVYSTGECWWYYNGKRHRNNIDKNGKLLPAYIGVNGEKEWWIHGNQLNKN